jgi:hypothetical protein
MKRTFPLTRSLLLIIVIASVLLFGCTAKDAAKPEKAPEEPQEIKQTQMEDGAKPRKPEGFESISSAGVSFYWKIVGDNLEGILEAETTGWIAVGFDPSSMMKDANFIIGYVEDGEAYIRDDWGNGATSHKSDEDLGGSNNVEILGGSEANGKTTLRFRIPLDSGDSYDKPIEPGTTYTVLFAYGVSDDFRGMHRSRGKAQITF